MLINPLILKPRPKKIFIYGVDIDYTNSNPETCVTYTDDAIGMTPGGASWDLTPVFAGIRPCMLKAGKVEYYLDPTNFAKKEDGSAADITTGGDGDVMTEIPKMGYSIETVGNTLKVRVTNAKDDPNFKYYAHTREEEGDRDFLYISAYKGWKDGSNKLRSLSGKTPTVNQTIGTFRTYAQANGTGYDQMAFYPLTLIQCLYLIKYKNLNSQTALGQGWTNQSAAATTGGLNSSGMFWGGTDKQQMKFAGIEDLWGNIWNWIDGMATDSSRNIRTAFTGFNNSLTGYDNRGQGATSNLSTQNIKTVQGTSESGFIIKTGTGATTYTTYFCDGGYLYSSCFSHFGGEWATGSRAGVFCYYIYHSAAGAHATLGGRIMYL